MRINVQDGKDSQLHEETAMSAVVQHVKPQNADKAKLEHVSFTSILVRDSLDGREGKHHASVGEEDEVKPDREAMVNGQWQMNPHCARNFVV